jgi:hypothetical protein
MADDNLPPGFSYLEPPKTPTHPPQMDQDALELMAQVLHRLLAGVVQADDPVLKKEER